MSKFENKTAFVTGANRGIGKAFVEELVLAGAKKVYAAARKIESLDILVKTYPDQVVPVTLDVTDIATAQKLGETLQDVDVLINNAGIAAFTSFMSAASLDEARSEMETNYFGLLNVTRAFGPVLAKNGGGILINIASIASLANFPVLGSYSASKAAVHSLTQGVRAELAAQNTFVAGVYPGPVDTAMAENFPSEKTSPNQVVKTIFEQVSAGVEEIYPDPAAVEMYGVFKTDPRAFEKQAGQMLPQ